MASLNASSSLASMRPRRARRRAGRPLRRRPADCLQVSYWKNLPTGYLGKSSWRGGASQQVSGYHVSLISHPGVIPTPTRITPAHGNIYVNGQRPTVKCGWTSWHPKSRSKWSLCFTPQFLQPHPTTYRKYGLRGRHVPLGLGGGGTVSLQKGQVAAAEAALFHDATAATVGTA